MQIKLGEKIRELRQRDSRTQETLAEALGVTSQAVSRWEVNRGYPDIEIIPAIANYFNITIDELFGYSSERDVRIKHIIDTSDSMLNEQINIEECICLLREAVSEFPAEVSLHLRLGYALTMYGFQKYGARRYSKENADYAVNDIEFNKRNEYFIEALMIFKKVLDARICLNDRQVMIPLMIRLYSLMGNSVEAENLAKKQDTIALSRECLLPNAVEGENRDIYQGEALLAIARQFNNTMIDAVQTKPNMAYNETGVKKLLGTANLYELLFEDGRCGEYHFDLMVLYRWCAIYAAKQDDIPKAMKYFEICFHHSKEYEAIRGMESYHYSASLVSKVNVSSKKWLTAPIDLWKGWQKYAPEGLIEALKKEGRYDECVTGC